MEYGAEYEKSILVNNMDVIELIPKDQLMKLKNVLRNVGEVPAGSEALPRDFKEYIQ